MTGVIQEVELNSEKDFMKMDLYLLHNEVQDFAENVLCFYEKIESILNNISNDCHPIVRGIIEAYNKDEKVDVFSNIKYFDLETRREMIIEKAKITSYKIENIEGDIDQIEKEVNNHTSLYKKKLMSDYDKHKTFFSIIKNKTS